RLWLRWQARLYLERRQVRDAPEVGQLFVEGLSSGLFQSLAPVAFIQGLRRRQPLPTRYLDVAATVAATVRQAGYFTPVGERRYVVPEYLALVDRKGAGDQQARFFDELLDWLVHNDVYVVRYSFEGDPRVCEPDEGRGRALGLRDLAARYPNHR